MFKRIIAAVGGPDASLEPARLAARLAAQSGAALTFVSVHKAPSPALGEPTYSERLLPRLAEAQATLDEARAIAVEAGVAEVELESIEGEPAEVIVSLARSGNFDLVVMGTHRRGRFGAALLGSVSNAVAARSGRPVMVVPEQAPADSAT
jgi:nucleotide-binding universal stress UspA family protein